MNTSEALKVFLVLSCLLIITQPVVALPETYVSTLSWQSPTTGVQYLPGGPTYYWGPHGIARNASDGVLFVAVDNLLVYSPNHMIVESFLSTNTLVYTWGPMYPSNPEILWSRDLAINSSGWIHITNEQDRRIFRSTPTSYSAPTTWISPIDTGLYEMINPTAIDIDSHDNIYVADSLHSRLFKLNSDGVPQAQSAPQPPGYRPSGIAVGHSGRIWVSDQNPSNYRVLYYTSITDTNPASFSSFKLCSEEAFFNRPAGIALDSSGNVYIVDSGNNRVVKGDSNGNLLALIGSGGSGSGQLDLNRSSDVAVDPDGACVYVTDSNHHLIQKYCKVQTLPITPCETPMVTPCCCCCNPTIPSDINVHVVPLSTGIPIVGIAFTAMICGLMKRKRDY